MSTESILSVLNSFVKDLRKPLLSGSEILNAFVFVFSALHMLSRFFYLLDTFSEFKYTLKIRKIERMKLIFNKLISNRDVKCFWLDKISFSYNSIEQIIIHLTMSSFFLENCLELVIVCQRYDYTDPVVKSLLKKCRIVKFKSRQN